MFNLSFSVKSKTDKLSQVINNIVALSKKRVLVGVPADENERKDEEGRPEKVGNAALAAIHNEGSELQNIPPRPFIDLGIKNTQERVNIHFLAAAKAQLNDDQEKVLMSLNKAGQIARDGIKNVLRTGDGLDPLTRETLLARTRKRKYLWGKLTKEQRKLLGKQEQRALIKENRETIMASMVPLFDTGNLNNSISYVVEVDGERVKEE